MKILPEPRSGRFTFSCACFCLTCLVLLCNTMNGQSVVINSTDPRHETQSQQSIAVLFSGAVSGSTSVNQWIVKIDGTTVTTVSGAIGTPSANYVTVTFDATSLNGVAYVLPDQTLTVNFTNTGNTLLVNTVPATSMGAGVYATSRNNWTGECSDVTFNQTNLIPGRTEDACVPVVEDFMQFQFYLSLRVRNSAAFSSGSLIHKINWGDGVTTNESSYQSDAGGIASSTFITSNAANPVVVMKSGPTHTYPSTASNTTGNRRCDWQAVFTPVLSFGITTPCTAESRTITFLNYDTENKNTGEMNLPASPLATSNKVTIGSNVNMQFSDNTLLNCRTAVESAVPNDRKRAIRITYGYRNAGGSGNIPDVRVTLPAILGGGTTTVTSNVAGGGSLLFASGYFPVSVGAADANGVIVLNAPVTQSTLLTYMGTITTVDPSNQAAGQRFYVRLEYWNVCNAYYSINPSTLFLAESIENYVEIIPTIPVIPQVLPATLITQTSFQANWSAISGATSYFVDVKDNAGSVLTNYSNVTASGTSLSVTGLSPGTGYQYVVRASNSSGTSASSAVQQVTTAVITGDMTSPSNELVAFPNPADDKLEVRGIKGILMSYQLTDATGRNVTIVLEGSGSFYSTSVKHLTQGLYILRLQDSSGSHQLKFVRK